MYDLEKEKDRACKAVLRLVEHARYTGDDAQDYTAEQDAEDVLTYIHIAFSRRSKYTPRPKKELPPMELEPYIP